MRVDLAEAFLEALTGSASTPVSWQTFSDRKPKPLPRTWRDPLARVLHGSLDRHVDELVRLNEAGAGIFVTVSETNLLGRHASDVVALRALFADVDAAAPELRVPASFSTETARGRNPFWKLRAGEAVCRFREAQTRIAALYGTDAAVKDPSRVMRVPGFLHRKAEPRLVGFVPGTGREWTISELLEVHPPAAPAPKRLALAPGRPQRPAIVGQGREAALLAIVAEKASGRLWTVGNRHASAVDTATHARKLGIGLGPTRDLVAGLLREAGKDDENEPGEVVGWTWENVSPDTKETADRPPEVAARKQLEKGVEARYVVERLKDWYGLTRDVAAGIVEKVAAGTRQAGETV